MLLVNEGAGQIDKQSILFTYIYVYWTYLQSDDITVPYSTCSIAECIFLYSYPRVVCAGIYRVGQKK